jgi:hypothetical protein
VPFGHQRPPQTKGWRHTQKLKQSISFFTPMGISTLNWRNLSTHAATHTIFNVHQVFPQN